jgi:glycosyltransferase involved in cell wall biosynthesis
MGVLDAAAREVPWPVYLAGDLVGPNGVSFHCSSLCPLGSLSHDEVMSWLRRSSIFVHPAVYEPFGLAVAEAAAAGCALVLADIPTLRELWDGVAEFFEPRDAGALKATLDALIADPTRRRAMSAAARQRATEYGAQAMGESYCQLYESLLQQTPAKQVTTRSQCEHSPPGITRQSVGIVDGAPDATRQSRGIVHGARL